MKLCIGGCRVLMVAMLLMFASCVDDTFRIDEVSKEVTVGGDSAVTLPLGSLNERTIGELLGDTEVSGLDVDAEGNFVYSYVGERSTVNIDGVTSEFEIPSIAASFDVDYPEFSFDMEPITINEEDDISISGLDSYITEGEGYIPEGLAMPRVECHYTHVIESDDLHIEFDVPEQIMNVDKIYFRDVDGNHQGAPMRFSVALNGLKDINAGGELKFDLTLEGGTFRILDADGGELCDGNHFSEQYTIAEGVETIDFVIYVESITNTTTLDNNHLNIPLKMTYNMELDVATKAGRFNINDKPHIALSADFVYGDADVAVDSSVDLVKCDVVGGERIMIKDLPEQLKSINRVTMAQNDNSIVNLYAHGMSWLGDLAEDIVVEVALPDYLKLYHVEGETYDFNEATGVLTASMAELDRGVKVAIEALDFGPEGISANDNGDVELLFEPTIVARFREGSHVSVSQLKHEDDFSVKVGVTSSILTIESLSGMVDDAFKVEETFALEGLDDIDVEIEGVGLKPVIEVNLSHPFTIDTSLSGVVTPSTDGELNEENAVVFDDVVIKAAEYVGGEIAPAEVTIIIADETLRDRYSDAKYTFVACDVTKLLVGSLPDAINIKLDLGVDTVEMQTLYVADDFSVSYDYKVEVPIIVDDTLRIRYSDEVADLSSTFEMVSKYDVQVGDVTLIAKVTNTTPLEFGANVVLKDVEGKETEAQVRIVEGDRILGSSDGVTPKESILRLELDLGDGGRITKLAEVDAVAFELVASSAANEDGVALNRDQKVGATLQLQIDGGVTVDIDQFIN